jgi:hypothetical protein
MRSKSKTIRHNILEPKKEEDKEQNGGTLQKSRNNEESFANETECRARAADERKKFEEEEALKERARAERRLAARNRRLLEYKLTSIQREKVDAYIKALRRRRLHENQKYQSRPSRGYQDIRVRAAKEPRDRDSLQRSKDLDNNKYRFLKENSRARDNKKISGHLSISEHKHNNRKQLLPLSESLRAGNLRKQIEKQERDIKKKEAPKDNPGPLVSRIPMGILSASLPWLKVRHNTIVTESEHQIILRGLNVHGFDEIPPDPSLGFMTAAGIGEEELGAICQRWNANVIRVPLNQEWALYGTNSWTASDYLEEIDRIIARAALCGAYTILCLQRLDSTSIFGTRPGPNGSRIANYIAPRPNADSIGFWQLMSERYQDEPAVIFDLYSSPHRALDDDLTGISPTWITWAMWARVLVAEIRRIRPSSLCLVSGLEFATDISGFPLRGSRETEIIPNLVYAIHIYPWIKQISWQAIDSLQRKVPIFVSEWGGRPQDAFWGEAIASQLRSRMIGWTASGLKLEYGLNDSNKKWLYEVQQPFNSMIKRAIALRDHRAERSLYT